VVVQLFTVAHSQCRVGQKNWTCLSVDNLVTVSGRNACNMSDVSECYREKEHNLNSPAFKYSLLNLEKSSPPQNYAEFDSNAWI